MLKGALIVVLVTAAATAFWLYAQWVNSPEGIEAAEAHKARIQAAQPPAVAEDEAPLTPLAKHYLNSAWLSLEMGVSAEAAPPLAAISARLVSAGVCRSGDFQRWGWGERSPDTWFTYCAPGYTKVIANIKTGEYRVEASQAP